MLLFVIMNDDLDKYVSDQLGLGVSEEEISNNLDRMGWGNEDVNLALSKVRESVDSSQKILSDSESIRQGNQNDRVKLFKYVGFFVLSMVVIFSTYYGYQYFDKYQDIKSAIRDAVIDSAPVTNSEMYDTDDNRFSNAKQGNMESSNSGLYSNTNPSTYVLASSTLYSSTSISNYYEILLPDVPSGYFVDEELGFKIRLPDLFENYQVEKRKSIEGSDYILDGVVLLKKGQLRYNLTFSVNTTEVDWLDSFPVFEIVVEPVSLWKGFGGKLTSDNMVVMFNNVPNGMYLAESDFLYKIDEVKIMCPDSYKKSFKNKPLPTPHCVSYESIFTHIADTFELIN